MFIVFVGAGASAAINHKKYPTTEKFYSMLPTSIIENNLFVEVKGFLENNNIKPIDIEHILDALEEIKNLLWKLQDNSGIVGHMTRNDSFTRIDAQFATSTLFKLSPNIRKHCYDLIVEIREFLFAIYNSKPTERELDIWKILIETIQNNNISKEIEIFTTNYDVVLEKAINMTDSGIHDGIILDDDRHAILNMEQLWNENTASVSFEKGGRLTKLHGSVNWQRHLGSNDSIFISPVFTGDLQKQVALYPGEAKNEPKKRPFSNFYKHFERSVERAAGFIFIGFSFRDEYINRILQEKSSAVKKYIITKNSTQNSTYPLPDFLQSDKKVKHNDKGFTQESVTDCLAYFQ